MGKQAAIPEHESVARRLAEKTLAAVMNEDIAACIDAAKAEDIMVLLAQIKLMAHDGILVSQALIAGDEVDKRKIIESLSAIKARLIQAGQVINGTARAH